VTAAKPGTAEAISSALDDDDIRRHRLALVFAMDVMSVMRPFFSCRKCARCAEDSLYEHARKHPRQWMDSGTFAIMKEHEKFLLNRTMLEATPALIFATEDIDMRNLLGPKEPK
jgi:hypothetical protein